MRSRVLSGGKRVCGDSVGVTMNGKLGGGCVWIGHRWVAWGFKKRGELLLVRDLVSRGAVTKRISSSWGGGGGWDGGERVLG